MSADNWIVCPQCKLRADFAREQKIIAAGKAYGDVTPEEYLEMVDEANGPIELGKTFREDYYCMVSSEGHLSIDYSGSCCVCKLSVKHKYEEDIKLSKQ